MLTHNKVVLRAENQITEKDINSYWIFENDPRAGKNRVNIRHFNTRKYLQIDRHGGKTRLTLSDRLTENSDLIFEAVNQTVEAVKDYNQDTIFKIRSEYKMDEYIRILSEDEIRKMQRLQGTFISNEANEKLVTISDQDCVNELDTFDLRFPKNRDLLEMDFCQDMNIMLKRTKNAIEKDMSDILPVVESMAPGLAKLLALLQGFLQNEFQGVIIDGANPGSIIPYR